MRIVHVFQGIKAELEIVKRSCEFQDYSSSAVAHKIKEKKNRKLYESLAAKVCCEEITSVPIFHFLKLFTMGTGLSHQSSENKGFHVCLPDQQRGTFSLHL